MWSPLLYKCKEDQRMLFFLYFLLKGTVGKPSNITAATNLFSNVYVLGMACFDEYFFSML